MPVRGGGDANRHEGGNETELSTDSLLTSLAVVFPLHTFTHGSVRGGCFSSSKHPHHHTTPAPEPRSPTPTHLHGMETCSASVVLRRGTMWHCPECLLNHTQARPPPTPTPTLFVGLSRLRVSCGWLGAVNHPKKPSFTTEPRESTWPGFTLPRSTTRLVVPTQVSAVQN